MSEGFPRERASTISLKERKVIYVLVRSDKKERVPG